MSLEHVWKNLPAITETLGWNTETFAKKMGISFERGILMFTHLEHFQYQHALLLFSLAVIEANEKQIMLDDASELSAEAVRGCVKDLFSEKVTKEFRSQHQEANAVEDAATMLDIFTRTLCTQFGVDELELIDFQLYVKEGA